MLCKLIKKTFFFSPFKLTLSDMFDVKLEVHLRNWHTENLFTIDEKWHGQRTLVYMQSYCTPYSILSGRFLLCPNGSCKMSKQLEPDFDLREMPRKFISSNAGQLDGKAVVKIKTKEWFIQLRSMCMFRYTVQCFVWPSFRAQYITKSEKIGNNANKKVECILPTKYTILCLFWGWCFFLSWLFFNNTEAWSIGQSNINFDFCLSLLAFALIHCVPYGNK